MAAAVGAGFAFDFDRAFGEDRGGVEQGAVVFSAIEAVAEADTVGRACRLDADLAERQAAVKRSMFCFSFGNR